MRSILKFLIISCAVVISSVYVWKICTSRIIADEQPNISTQYYPGYSKALLAMNKAVLKNGLVQSQADLVIERSKKALIRSPIHDSPFLHIALAESFLSNNFTRHDLFVAAKVRNRRNRSALRGLLAIDAAKNDFPSVIESLNTLLILRGGSRSTYHDALSAVSLNPDGRELINTYLEERPIWGKTFLNNQIKNMNVNNIPVVTTFLQRYSLSKKERTADKKIQQNYLAKLITIGAYRQAYQYFQDNLPITNGQNPSLVFDGQFHGSTALIPFNWEVFRGEKYFAEINQEEGLFASYADKKPRMLSRQVLVLKPGIPYQLNLEAQWRYKVRQGEFYWRISCLSSQKEIARLALNNSVKGTESSTVEASLDFIVPNENCEAQSLELRAEPKQYSMRIWLMTKSIEIFPFGE